MAQVLVAEELGRGSVLRARQVADRLGALALGLGVALLGGFAVGGGVLPAVFAADAEVAAVVERLLVYVAIMQPLNALVFVGDGVGQGSDDFSFLCGAMLAAGAAALAFLVWMYTFFHPSCPCMHACMHACMPSYPHACMHPPTNTHTHTFQVTSEDSIDAVWQGLMLLQIGRAAGLAWRFYGGSAAGDPCM